MTDSRCTSVRELRQRRTRSRSKLDSTASITSSYGISAAAIRRSRSASFCTDRTRSTARRWASVITQAVALPRPASNLDAVRHTSSRTSWVTSSDWAGSRITRLTTPNTDGPICSKMASKAAASPRATRVI